VETFKAEIKRLTKDSKLVQAIDYANTKNATFDLLSLRDEVTYVHWWVKAYSVGSDMR